MPPYYKPLTEGIPSIPPEIFGAPKPVSIQELQSEDELLRARQLANAQNALTLSEATQRVDQRQKVREALASEYGNNANMDPNAGLALAQRLALQSGDLETALTIERAQKERSGDMPLSPAQRELYQRELGPLPEGITSNNLNVLSAMQRARAYSEQVGENIDKRSDTIASFAPGGFEADVDPATGQGPNREDGKKFTATVAAHSRINSDLDLLEQSLRISNGNDPADPEFQRQKALLGDIAIALKEKNNFGAALTKNEEMLNNSALPQIFARSDVGIGQALLASGLGRDPFDAINTMRVLLSTDFDQQKVIYKFRNKADVAGLPAAQSGASFRIPRSGYGDMSFQRSPAPPSGSLPRNGDGSPLTREQFMALNGGR